MPNENANEFDAVLMIAYGSPERMEDVVPYLKLVTKGRVPEARLKEVGSHYELFGGKSPLNEWTYKQAGALEGVLAEHNTPMKVYVGMRYWHPFMADTLKAMADDGVRRAVGVIMASQQSDSSWDQYLRVVEEAKAEAGVDIEVVYTEPAYDYPKFIEAATEHVKESLDKLSAELRDTAPVLFTAHSIPYSDPQHERYVEQMTESCRLVAKEVGWANWRLCYQSRSGRPTDPWLEPDINDVIKELAEQGGKAAVMVPIGFVCDHIEVLYDLDTQAMATGKEAGIVLERAKTVNDNQKYIEGLGELVGRVIDGGCR